MHIAILSVFRTHSKDARPTQGLRWEVDAIGRRGARSPRCRTQYTRGNNVAAEALPTDT